MRHASSFFREGFCVRFYIYLCKVYHFLDIVHTNLLCRDMDGVSIYAQETDCDFSEHMQCTFCVVKFVSKSHV